MKSIEENGVWFLPNNPDKKIYGQLKFSAEEHPKLNLLDQLQEIKLDNNIFKGLKFDIVNGYLVNDKKVTLCNCVQSGRFTTNSIQTSTVYAKYLIIGHHFKTLEEICLNGVSLRYKNLEDWVDLPNFEINSSASDEHNQIKEINIKQVTQEPIELGKLLDFSLTLCDEPIGLERLHMAGCFRTVDNKITLEVRKSIIVRADSEKRLEDIIDVIYLSQKLLIFASGQMTYPFDIKSDIVVIEEKISLPPDVRCDLISGFNNPNQTTKEVVPIVEEKEKSVPLKIYFQVRESENSEAKFNSRRVLFSFKDVKEQFTELLSHWEENSKKLESVIDLYLRLTYIPKRHINDIFLSLAQAIEAFHGLAHSGRHIDKKIYRKVVRKALEEAVNSIPDSIPLENEAEESLDLREYKRILKEEKLSHLNSFSLRERLEEIVSEYRSCLPDNFFTPQEDQSRFLEKIRKTRNHLTHLSSDQDEYVASGQDLEILSRRLMVLLEACLLKQLGLEDVDVKTITSRNR
ncbi:MAG: hypothetical protein HC919_06015 [Oscillatoriales cyanobacterium SM2_2_1]|nr:hypothetical protein [Oscillatoriales cyanobacterium SM2_2_1]